MDEILQELNNNHKWLDDNYKNSNYYKEYITKVCQAFKNEIVCHTYND